MSLLSESLIKLEELCAEEKSSVIPDYENTIEELENKITKLKEEREKRVKEPEAKSYPKKELQ